VRLTSDWKEYSIDLRKKDLRHIIAGFGVFLSKAENPGGATFYVDDILYEGPESGQAAMSDMPTDLTGRLPSETTAQVTAARAPAASAAAEVPAAAKDLTVKQVDTGLKVSFSSRLMFKPAESVLEESSGKVLDQLINLLNAYPSNRVLIEGHTDKTGNPAFNLKLSELRAKAVRDYLIAHGGYDASRFQITGYGDTKPIAGNDTKAGRAQNRRVEVTILKTANP
jgi:outer membrane protein OmpA-like peptidoglycan-associated protein